MTPFLQQKADALVLIAFFASFVACTFLAVRMPVFHHVDELEHFDYVLKIIRGADITQFGQPVEPDLQQLYERNIPVTNYQYFGQAEAASGADVRISHEIMQPRGFYFISGLVLKAASFAALSLEQQVVLLRILSVWMVVISKVLVYQAIRLIMPAAGLLAAVYLAAFLPVDMLRFSNDTPAMLVGAATAWCLVNAQRTQSWRYDAALMLLLVMALFTKLTAAVFLFSGVVCVKIAFLERAYISRQIKSLVIVCVPFLISAALVGWFNLSNAGSLSGMPPANASTQPEGIAILQRALSASIWVWWHEALVTCETLIRGVRGADVYPVHVLTTFLVLGQILALGWALFSETRACVPTVNTANPMVLKRWLISGLASIAAMQLSIVIILGVFGQIWLGGRMLMPVEFWPLMVASCGYALMCERLPQGWPRRSAWFLVALAVVVCWLMAADTYLDFRSG